MAWSVIVRPFPGLLDWAAAIVPNKSAWVALNLSRRFICSLLLTSWYTVQWFHFTQWQLIDTQSVHPVQNICCSNVYQNANGTWEEYWCVASEIWGSWFPQALLPIYMQLNNIIITRTTPPSRKLYLIKQNYLRVVIITQILSFKHVPTYSHDKYSLCVHKSQPIGPVWMLWFDKLWSQKRRNFISFRTIDCKNNDLEKRGLYSGVSKNSKDYSFDNTMPFQSYKYHYIQTHLTVQNYSIFSNTTIMPTYTDTCHILSFCCF